MKQSATVEKCICDVCKTAVAHRWNACLRCGKDFCYECRKENAREYPHGVFFSGSDDGTYCNECDAILTASGADPMHNAYRTITSLRIEYRSWQVDFTKRMDSAETALKALQQRAP